LNGRMGLWDGIGCVFRGVVAIPAFAAFLLTRLQLGICLHVDPLLCRVYSMICCCSASFAGSLHNALKESEDQ
jgi:hypothetical protein